jgi:Protein of unknown function (DUF1449)
MNELIEQALFAPTLPLTILLGGLVIYWLVTAVGISVADGDSLEQDGDVSGDHGAWGSFLAFLNIGEVPVMIVLTVLVVAMWTLSMLAGHFWSGGSVLLGFVFLVPSFVVACVITRYATSPFKKALRLLNSEGDAPVKLVGRVCVVTTTSVTGRYGQASVAAEGAPLIVQVRAQSGDDLRRGDSALIISENSETGIFSVRKITNEKLEN